MWACPNIRDLELLVPRPKGDEAEAHTYLPLAEVRVLGRLSLPLDCSHILAVEEDSDENSRDEDPGGGSDECSGEGSTEADESSWHRHARNRVINLNT